MFTGIVQGLGTLAEKTERGGDIRLRVETEGLDLSGVRPGDSISVGGACLTVVAQAPRGFSVDVSRETLRCTTLGRLPAGAPVNLELSVTPASALGGHLVTGHVDGLGRLVERAEDARSMRLRIEVPGPLARYIAAKGSICVDGVSLTVNDVEGTRFGVNIIPHTAAVTTLGKLEPEDAVNIEVDLIARYVERLLGPRVGTLGAK